MSKSYLYVCALAMSDSLQTHGLQPTRLLCPWHFPCKNTGVGCHFLLQGIIPTQGSNPGLLLGRQILYHCATWGAPGLLRPLPHFYSCILASLPEYLLCSSLLCPCPQHSLHPPPSNSHQWLTRAGISYVFRVCPCVFCTISESSPVGSPLVARNGNLSLPPWLFSLSFYLGSPNNNNNKKLISNSWLRVCF